MHKIRLSVYAAALILTSAPLSSFTPYQGESKKGTRTALMPPYGDLLLKGQSKSGFSIRRKKLSKQILNSVGENGAPALYNWPTE
jgi:hypothetical protein